MAPFMRLRRLAAFAVLLAGLAAAAAPAARANATDDHIATLSRAAADPGLATWQRTFYKQELDALLSGATSPSESPAPAASASLPAAPVWSRIAETPRRQGHTMVLDTLSGRLIVFGGTDGTTVTNSLFAIDPDGVRTWRRLRVTGDAPPARMAHTAVFDGANRRMLVYGGTDQYGSYLADLWALNLDGTPTWTLLSPGGVVPSARANHFAVVDTLNHRMLLYGGGNGGFSPLHDLWALPLGENPTWSTIAPTTGVDPTFTPAAAMMDERNHRLVLAGSLSNTSYYITLEFLSVNSQPPAWGSWTTPYSGAPYDYYPYTFVMDNTNSRLVALPSDYTPQQCTLTITGASAWVNYPATGAPPIFRYGRAVAVDEKHRRVFVSGGGNSYSLTARAVCDLSSLDLAGYSLWTAVAGEPPASEGHSLAYDPARGTAYLFGGSTDSTGSGYGSQMSNRLWAMDASSEEPAWSPVVETGGPILPRQFATLAVDPARDQLVLFGGTNGSAYTNELWVRPLSGGTAWSQPVLSGPLPHQRSNAAAVYDPLGDRILVFGGIDAASNGLGVLGDLWALNLGGTPHWTHLAPAGTAPPARLSAQFTFDTVHECAYLIGGSNNYYGSGSGSLRAGEVWKLSFSPSLCWDKIANGLPGSSYYYDDVNGAAFYDTDQGALMRLSSPYDGTNVVVSTLIPDADTLWTSLTPGGTSPVRSSYALGVFDRDVRRVIWFGGFSNSELGTWALSLGTPPLAVPPSAQPAARAMTVFPNPAQNRVGVRFALPQPGKVQLELIDLSGRRVRGPVVANCPAGPFELALPEVGALPAGVYFARLSGATNQHARVAIVR